MAKFKWFECVCIDCFDVTLISGGYCDDCLEHNCQREEVCNV